jgi:hypothetical protein
MGNWVGGVWMADLWLAYVITSAIFGLVGYVFAKKTGRNPAIWVTLGVVLNVFALILFLGKDSHRK